MCTCYTNFSALHLTPTMLPQLYNMTEDLHITDKQYLIALTVFFFPYSLFEVSGITLVHKMFINNE